MKRNFIARTTEEAQQVFGTTFYAESRPETQPELDERVQLGAFLRTYALSAACQFPIEVNIPLRDQRPDFKVTFGRAEVGIEASKIANWELEEVRSVQRQETLGTIEISSLLQRRPKRSRSQKIADCTSIPVFIFPDSNQLQGEDAFWLEQAQLIIQRKHAITKQPTFNRYGESWLLLWDKLSYEEELERRVETLADWLVQFWKGGFFAQIIIQQQHSERFLILSRQGVEILQKQAVSPVAEFSIPEGCSLGLE
jgi:hypothetical protein